MSLTRRERPSMTRKSLRERLAGFLHEAAASRAEGGTHIYVLCMFIMMFLLVLFRAMFDAQRLYITKDTVDDALMTSMVSACVYNREEKNSSGAVVLYRTVTPLLGEVLAETVGGRIIPDPDPVDVFSLPDLTLPGGDPFLANSYALFVKNLKKNLKLHDDMTATISGIDGVVTINEFSVYNKFYSVVDDGSGNRVQDEFKFVRYSCNPETGAWSAYAYAPNVYPTTYNSLTKSNYEIRETSISVELGFTVVTGTATGMSQELGHTQAEYNVPVTYHRIVDVKLANP